MTQNHPDGPRLPLKEVYILQDDFGKLHQHGYRGVEQVSEPGEYAVVDRDVAPGWGQWMYLIEIYELPDKPLRELGI